jgi:hypothetical protein
MYHASISGYFCQIIDNAVQDMVHHVTVWLADTYNAPVAFFLILQPLMMLYLS